jgi:hypothetical protein
MSDGASPEKRYSPVVDLMELMLILNTTLESCLSYYLRDSDHIPFDALPDGFGGFYGIL